MRKTTYLFGAGASAQALPSMADFNVELANFRLYLIQVDDSNKMNWDLRILTYESDLRILIKLLTDLLESAQAHETIDTLARKYWLQGDWIRYRNLKIVLSAYFLFKQLTSTDNSKMSPSYKSKKLNVDKRYDSLFAQFLKKDASGNIEAQSNINIITWNYDLQIEFALRSFILSSSINDIKAEFQIHPNRNSFDHPSGPFFNSNKFYTIKLNGNAFFDLGHDDGISVTVYDRLIDELKITGSLSHDFVLAELLSTIARAPGFSIGDQNTFLKYFNYSWEESNGDVPVYPSKNLLLEEISLSMAESDTLIIVGYSFPNFNHDVDKKWLSKSNFKKIIIQDKFPEFIESRLRNLIPQFQQPEHKSNVYPSIVYQEIGPYFPISF